MSEHESRDPQTAIEEIRAKIGRGEEPTDEEREFLETERVRLDPEDQGDAPVA